MTYRCLLCMVVCIHMSNIDSSIHKGSAPLKFPCMEWIILNLSLYMPYKRSGDITQLNLNLEIKRRRIASITSLPTYCRCRGPGTHRRGGWVGCRVGLDVSERKTCCPCRKSYHNCCCPVRSLVTINYAHKCSRKSLNFLQTLQKFECVYK